MGRTHRDAGEGRGSVIATVQGRFNGGVSVSERPYSLSARALGPTLSHNVKPTHDLLALAHLLLPPVPIPPNGRPLTRKKVGNRLATCIGPRHDCSFYRFGTWTAVTASQGSKRERKMRSEIRSAGWTTDIAQMPTLRA
ncbi:DUF4113 domain-containing protein [Sphingomonas sp. UV9]|nr:DUF4113 domain-containing protein [Sphingomonas sp. UV9]